MLPTENLTLNELTLMIPTSVITFIANSFVHEMDTPCQLFSSVSSITLSCINRKRLEYCGRDQYQCKSDRWEGWISLTDE